MSDVDVADVRRRVLFRETVLLALLVLAAGSVVVGVAMISPSAAWIVAGIIAAAIVIVAFGVST